MTATQNHRDQPRPHDSNAPRTPAQTRVPRSRAGGLWVAAVAFTLVLLFLLIFVLQNGTRVDVSFLGAHGKLPLGVALLLASIFGVLLVALPGTARIMQLRMLDHRRQRPVGTRPATGRTAQPPDGSAGQRSR